MLTLYTSGIKVIGHVVNVNVINVVCSVLLELVD
jgi:hypothetical protein